MAAGGGVNQGPTPWWQLPGQQQKATNLASSAPAGYTYDPVKMGYTQTIGSAGDVQSQADLQRQREATVFGEQQSQWQTDQSQKNQLFGQYSNALTGLQHAVGSFGSPGAFGAPTTSSPYTPPPVTYSGMPSSSGVDAAATAAQNAAFGSAKAKAGAMGRTSVDSLRGELADRGMLGSGTETRGITDRLAAATNPLSDLNTAQLHENVGILQHNQDIAAQAANSQFQGNITQRGQDIQSQEAAAQLQAQERARQQQMLSQALSGLQRLF